MATTKKPAVKTAKAVKETKEVKTTAVKEVAAAPTTKAEVAPAVKEEAAPKKRELARRLLQQRLLLQFSIRAEIIQTLSLLKLARLIMQQMALMMLLKLLTSMYSRKWCCLLCSQWFWWR